MGTPGDEEETHPNWRSRFAAANKKADPIVDRAMKMVMDSPYTAVIVVSVVIGIVGLAKWWLG